jgi:hypothetical protein
MVVADIAKLPKGAHPPIGGSSATQDVAAKLLNVSVRSGQRARYVKDHGTPDLVDAVKHGDVRVAAAAEFVKQNPPLDQHRLIAEHGSAAAAVKATVQTKADRAVSKILRPTADPKPAADRAEAKAKLAIVSEEPRPASDLDATRSAYIAAIVAMNFTIEQRVKEIEKIMDATRVKLLRDFGITWTKIKRAQRARRSGKRAGA